MALLVSGAVGCSHDLGRSHGGGGDGGDTGDGGDNGDGGGGCVGLECQQKHDCAGGALTTLTGTVTAPNGTLPLYNAIVYVPNTQPAAFKKGVTCDRCGGIVSGNPVVKTLSNPDGSFKLEDVPVGKDIPLVVQLGKWRRQVKITNVPACTSSAVDTGLTRLPRNRSEGDIPQMAIVTGAADPFECLFLKLGLDKAEITRPDATTPGSLHYYVSSDNPGLELAPSAGGPAPQTAALFKDLNTLLKYDLIVLPCESKAYDKASDQRSMLAQYLAMGGRLFDTHFSYSWLTYDGSPYNKVAKTQKNGLWPVGQGDRYTIDNPPPNNMGMDVATGTPATVDTTFDKGNAFAKWLALVGASINNNIFNVFQLRHDLTDVDSKYAQQWMTANFDSVDSKGNPVVNGTGVIHTTFNTPLDPATSPDGQPLYCGRVVFSDFHVTYGATTSGWQPGQGDRPQPYQFPDQCKMNMMTTQEKALIFMLFDLSSCVQKDTIPPIP